MYEGQRTIDPYGGEGRLQRLVRRRMSHRAAAAGKDEGFQLSLPPFLGEASHDFELPLAKKGFAFAREQIGNRCTLLRFDECVAVVAIDAQRCCQCACKAGLTASRQADERPWFLGDAPNGRRRARFERTEGRGKTFVAGSAGLMQKRHGSESGMLFRGDYTTQ